MKLTDTSYNINFTTLKRMFLKELKSYESIDLNKHIELVGEILENTFQKLIRQEKKK